MSALDDEIAAARAVSQQSTNADTLAKQEALQTTEGSLNTEQAAEDAAYKEGLTTQGTAFGNALNTARESAASRGVYRSGLLTNAELTAGTANENAVNNLTTARTQKLADIANRRSLAETQTANDIAQIGNTNNANLENTIVTETNAYNTAQEKAAASAAKPTAEETKAAAGQQLISDVQTNLAAWVKAGLPKGYTEQQLLPELYAAYQPYGFSTKDIANIVYSTRKNPTYGGQ